MYVLITGLVYDTALLKLQTRVPIVTKKGKLCLIPLGTLQTREESEAQNVNSHAEDPNRKVLDARPIIPMSEYNTAETL